MFFSAHYSGDNLVPKFRNGESRKKVFGPLFMYLNSTWEETDPHILWEDANLHLRIEVECQPYAFPLSEDYQKVEERGSVTDRLLVCDRYIDEQDLHASSAYIGLALPGEVGSWQTECKGYQFWTRAEADAFSIKNIHTGYYNTYAWVPWFVGDYMYDTTIAIISRSRIDFGNLVHRPPRDSPMLWEIGYPDRSAVQFYIPDPKPNYINRLYRNHPDRVRQYGLWERYADLYPDSDLAFTLGVSDFTKDWFFAENAYSPTNWQIKFKLDYVNQTESYML
ncbi:hypothetical protein IEQ34_022637 [Dendrobium chrysotoxum]|uniref:Uncharacterized protein n=1 Tax=Dendrobium chrysotoxum TaxID=161865 RepID=A0AAV7FZL3_DENCH|nr:hypothetical protein IEQ34_022637 [Dendrobium chrysotoxum]